MSFVGIGISPSSEIFVFFSTFCHSRALSKLWNHWCICLVTINRLITSRADSSTIISSDISRGRLIKSNEVCGSCLKYSFLLVRANTIYNNINIMKEVQNRVAYDCFWIFSDCRIGSRSAACKPPLLRRLSQLSYRHILSIDLACRCWIASLSLR